MKFYTKLLAAAICSTIVNANVEDPCGEYDSFRMDLFHSGFYKDNKCSYADASPL